MNEQSQFLQLCTIIDTLLGPEGCPWDKKQTLDTLRESVLDETCELIDAIEEKDAEQMADELGDLLLNVIFLARVAAKEGHFVLGDSLAKVINKLISRHPHIFGNGPTLSSAEEVASQWDAIKRQEKGHAKRTSAMDDLPKALPALFRAKKMIGKMKKAKYQLVGSSSEITEKDLGEKLFQLAIEGESCGLNAELALKKICAEKEKAFRDWEASQKQ